MYEMGSMSSIKMYQSRIGSKYEWVPHQSVSAPGVGGECEYINKNSERIYLCSAFTLVEKGKR